MSARVAAKQFPANLSLDAWLPARGGRTVSERALALIGIAHPDHREPLLAEARRLGFVTTADL